MRNFSAFITMVAAALSGISTAFGANERLIGVANYCITVPANSAVNYSEGPDFSVTYISTKDQDGSVGIYEGGHPNSFAKDKPSLTTKVARFRNSNGRWTLWEDSAGGPAAYHAEIMLPSGSTTFHLFVAAKTAENREKMLTVAESFRPALPTDTVEHPPKPERGEPRPPEPRANSESAIGFRTQPVSAKPVADAELAYFLSHMQIVAENPATRPSSDRRPSYRIIGVGEQGNFVQGGPRTVVMVVVWDYSKGRDGHIRAFRVEGVHFWSFLGVDEWKADDAGGPFLTFRFQSMPEIDRKENYRVQVGFDSASVTKVNEEKR